MKPQYKFYATLLDAFQWYLDSEQETAEKDFIDKINRVPFQSDAADKGKAFNDLIDVCLTKGWTSNELSVMENIQSKYGFNTELIDSLVKELQGSVPQYFCSRVLHTSKGSIEIYGYMDFIKFTKAIDLKTTKTYTLGKYDKSWQKVVYPWCLVEDGIFVDEFEFLVTDFEHIYKEPYPINIYNIEAQLTVICLILIDFIEAKRHLITDKKIFGEDTPKLSVVV